MSDDIVTRLREHAEDEAMLGNDWLRDVMRDASAEIERLRAEVDSKDAQAYRHLRRLYDERGGEISRLENEIRELGQAVSSLAKARDRAIRALVEAVRGE